MDVAESHAVLPTFIDHFPYGIDARSLTQLVQITSTIGIGDSGEFLNAFLIHDFVLQNKSQNRFTLFFTLVSQSSPGSTGRSTKKVHGSLRRKALSMSQGRFLPISDVSKADVAPTTTIPYLLSVFSESIPSHSCKNSDFIWALGYA